MYSAFEYNMLIVEILQNTEKFKGKNKDRIIILPKDIDMHIHDTYVRYTHIYL